MILEGTLVSLLILIIVVIVALWLIRQIPWPAGLEIIGVILQVIVVVIALFKVLAYL